MASMFTPMSQNPFSRISGPAPAAGPMSPGLLRSSGSQQQTARPVLSPPFKPPVAQQPQDWRSQMYQSSMGGPGGKGGMPYQAPTWRSPWLAPMGGVQIPQAVGQQSQSLGMALGGIR